MITLPPKTYIWIAAGVTDLRRGFDGLSALVQTKLEQSPFSGHVFVFRGRRGDLIKVLWWDGDGLCLFAKRLERGRFVWPQAMEGGAFLSRTATMLSLAQATETGPDVPSSFSSSKNRNLIAVVTANRHSSVQASKCFLLSRVCSSNFRPLRTILHQSYSRSFSFSSSP